MSLSNGPILNSIFYVFLEMFIEINNIHTVLFDFFL